MISVSYIDGAAARINGAGMARRTPASAKAAPIAPSSPVSPEKLGGMLRLRRAPMAHANGAANGARHDAESVLARLEEAGTAMLAMPNTGYGTRLRTSQVDIVRTAIEAYGWQGGRLRPAMPDAATITRMDEAMAWLALIPVDRYVLRRIVGARSLVSPSTGRYLFPWRRLGGLLGADHKAIQRWHAQGIDLIVAALNAAGK